MCTYKPAFATQDLCARLTLWLILKGASCLTMTPAAFLSADTWEIVTSYTISLFASMDTGPVPLPLKVMGKRGSLIEYTVAPEIGRAYSAQCWSSRVHAYSVSWNALRLRLSLIQTASVGLNGIHTAVLRRVSHVAGTSSRALDTRPRVKSWEVTKSACVPLLVNKRLATS